MNAKRKAMEIFKDLTVLCVEDEEGVRESLVEFLERRFKTVIAAENGEVGLNAFREHQPDIVMTDIQMPVKNGLQMAREIREESGDVPIIVVSAFNDISYLQEAIDIGVGSYVSKPVDGRKMTETLLKSAQRLKYHTTLNKLEESQEIFRTVAEHSPSGICLYKEQFLFVNKAMEQITGYRAEELLAMNVRDYLLADMHDHQTAHDAPKDHESYVHPEVTIVTKSGETKYLDITTGVIQHQGENVNIANITDITQRKWFEDELEMKQRALETLNEELKQNILLIEQKNKKLATQLYTDNLTNLPNRFKLLKDLSKADHGVMVILNIDSFKEVNDFYGDKIGDFVLNEIAQRFITYQNRSCLRLYKLQADEYAFFCCECPDLPSVESLLDEMREAMEDHLIYVRDQEIHIGLTAGIAFGPGENLLAHADIALKDAKKRRKPYVIYDESLKLLKAYENNIKWLHTLKNALDNNRVIAYFQPITNNKTGKIEKFECLARLIDEDGEVYTPYHFMEIAKRSRLYKRITRSVFLDAITAFSDMPYTFSINLSIEDILDEETTTFIKRQLGEHEDVAGRVVFEILESEGIENYEAVRTFIREMKQLGVQIAIDDFGSGYSNFAHILELDVDYLKIDASIIKNVATDHNSRIICQTLVGFAQRLGIQTVAEFVNSDTIKILVTQYGVDYSQGYHLGRPERIIP